MLLLVRAWYGEITLILFIFKHKVHKNKNPFKYFNYVPIGHKCFKK